MRELPLHYPEVEALLALAPEELGAKMALLLQIRITNTQSHNGQFNGYNITSELDQHTSELEAYLGHKRAQALLAVAEGWAWLEREGYLIAPPGDAGRYGWRVFSRQQLTFAPNGRPMPRGASLLPKEALLDVVRDAAWPYYVRGDYETAVFKAMRQVEIELRAASQLGGDLPAVKLARSVFHAENGMLTDPDAEPSEREAMAHLFAGALGVLKNPHSHRSVDVDSAADAASLIMFANYLCGIIHRRHSAFMLA